MAPCFPVLIARHRAHFCTALTAAGQAAGERSIFDFSVRQYGKHTSLDAYEGKVRPTALPLRMSLQNGQRRVPYGSV